MSRTLVVDASAVVDLMIDAARSPAIADAMTDAHLLAPAHVDAEVLSALARLQRAEVLSARRCTSALDTFTRMPIERAPLAGLLPGAWRRRHNLRIPDALYAELAAQRGAGLLTCDVGLASHVKDATLIR